MLFHPSNPHQFQRQRSNSCTPPVVYIHDPNIIARASNQRFVPAPGYCGNTVGVPPAPIDASRPWCQPAMAAEARPRLPPLPPGFQAQPPRETRRHTVASPVARNQLNAPSRRTSIASSAGDSDASDAISVIEVAPRRMSLRMRIPEEEHIAWADIKTVRHINEGSFGAVDEAIWKGKTVAVKKFKLDGQNMTPERLKAVARELNSYRGITHPNIVKYYGTVSEFPDLAVVTELIDKGDLFDLMYMQQKPYTASERLRFAQQLCSAVDYLHRQEPVIIHRDLKSENCLLDASGSLKLCDFGLSKVMRGDGVVLLSNGGSPRYMAPEAFHEGNVINEKVDIWSLACCLIEFFGGPVPLEHYAETDEVVAAVMNRKESPIVPKNFEPRLQALLQQALNVDPDARPSAADFSALLAGFDNDLVTNFKMDHRLF